MLRVCSLDRCEMMFAENAVNCTFEWQEHHMSKQRWNSQKLNLVLTAWQQHFEQPFRATFQVLQALRFWVQVQVLKLTTGLVRLNKLASNEQYLVWAHLFCADVKMWYSWKRARLLQFEKILTALEFSSMRVFCRCFLVPSWLVRFTKVFVPGLSSESWEQKFQVRFHAQYWFWMYGCRFLVVTAM